MNTGDDVEVLRRRVLYLAEPKFTLTKGKGEKNHDENIRRNSKPGWT